MIKVYCYSKCSTCKKALKWLDDRGVAYEKIVSCHTVGSDRHYAFESPYSVSLMHHVVALMKI